MNETEDLVTIFEGVDVSDLSTPHSLDSDRARALWVLVVGARSGIDVITPGEIRVVLRDVFGVSVSRQRIEGILSRERGAVARRTKNGKRAYQIMEAGKHEIVAQSPVVVFIDPEKALSGIRKSQEVLAGAKGGVRICDPYVDGRTLDFLAECTDASEIRLLTSNVHKKSAFKRDLKAFSREHSIPLVVRVAPQGVLHDRYLIHDDGMMLIGTSLNSLGSKQSFIVAVGEDIRKSVLSVFERVWSSSPLLR